MAHQAVIEYQSYYGRDNIYREFERLLTDPQAIIK